ncbi:MAG: methyltransferase domain-containing protein [Thaumarchaeota archaeon]|nr:methyltransferase domain-containing protein [Candidatus Calditenuaceae archaeon]MDW8186721.1 methyltransferase domain-containing protein [Nitrososphaerota archaeon]
MAKQRTMRDVPWGTGPVPLEEREERDWWRKLFNDVYLLTDGDVVCNRRLTEYEVDIVIDLLDLDKDDPLLDLCCGNGRHSLELARRGFRKVYGLDYSQTLLNVARDSALSEGLLVDFRQGDARRLPYEDNAFNAVIMMGNSFGYFRDEADNIRVLREVHRVLRPYGRLLMDLTDAECFRNTFEPVRAEVHDHTLVVRLRELSRDRSRFFTREIVISGDAIVADQVYGIRLYTFDELKRLLREAGFVNVALRTKLTYNPVDKDPGMMGSRMVVTALASKEPKNTGNKPLIVVLLGDPRRPHPVKPGFRFDEDDVHAVNELRSALHGIGDYTYAFLDDHSKMLHFLMEKRNSIHMVLNLCDDGFFNDPYKEGHVAAVLDVLDVRYTGAGPACLSICYDKSAVKAVARSMGIPVPYHLVVNSVRELRSVSTRLLPAVVKPNYGDNSWGITSESLVKTTEELVNAFRSLREEWKYSGPVIVEKFIEGDDLTVSMIGNPPNLIFLPVLKEDYSQLPAGLPRILTYDAKWNPNSPYWRVNSVPAHLDDGLRAKLLKWSEKLFVRLGCRDYARFDWRLGSDGVPRLLEANPNPGWVWDGHLRKACKHAGWTYERMFKEIIRAAEKRYALKNQNGNEFKHLYPST